MALAWLVSVLWLFAADWLWSKVDRSFLLAFTIPGIPILSSLFVCLTDTWLKRLSAGWRSLTAILISIISFFPIMMIFEVVSEYFGG